MPLCSLLWCLLIVSNSLQLRNPVGLKKENTCVGAVLCPEPSYCVAQPLLLPLMMLSMVLKMFRLLCGGPYLFVNGRRLSCAFHMLTHPKTSSSAERNSHSITLTGMIKKTVFTGTLSSVCILFYFTFLTIYVHCHLSFITVLC